MFRKLRNRLILINLGITSVVILIVFSTIYLVSTNTAKMRPSSTMNNYYNSVPLDNLPSGDLVEQINSLFRNSIEAEREAAANQLLLSLFISGLLIEIAVAFISYLLAEEAIKPVKEAFVTQKMFIANASHEIKTPLAAIAANLEAADIHDNQFIDNVARETEKLTRLNTDLLTLARTDMVKEVKSEEVDLEQLVETSLQSLSPRLEKINFRKKISVTKVKINVADFMQIFNILMDNAIKYQKSKIFLELDEHKLIISNDGKKIKPADLEHIFERFYQIDKTSEGVGLGLAIARATAENNQWKLTATSGELVSFQLEF